MFTQREENHDENCFSMFKSCNTSARMNLFFLVFIGSIYIAHSEVCKDIAGRYKCLPWKTAGYCYNNVYVRTNCKLSCGRCVSNSVCKDKQPNLTCAKWKRSGYCTKGYSTSRRQWYAYMVLNCKSTCGFCNKKKVVTNTDCRNKNVNCDYWKRKNYCYRSSFYYTFMTQNCRLACRFCRKIVIKTTTTTTTKLPKPPVSTTKLPNPPVITTKLPNPPVITTKLPKPPVITTKLPNPPVITTKLPKPPVIETTTTPATENPKTTPTIPSTTPSTTSSKEIATTPSTKKPIFPEECGKDKREVIASTIVDGATAQANVWPWQAAIYNLKFDELACGGTLIAPQFIITAAHCLEDVKPEDLSIRLGDHLRDTDEGSEQDIEVQGFLQHGNYDSILSLNHDIALILLSKPAVLNENVNVACLPKQNETADMNSKCYVSGWGRMEAQGATVNTLQEAKLPLVSRKICGKLNKDKNGKSKITDNMLCAGDKEKATSGCSGDSGGPLVCKSKDKKWVLHGAVSWGSNKCDARKKYTVFARVSNYVDWIKSNIKAVMSE